MVKIEIGIVSKPLEADYGGDAYLIKEFPGKVLLAIIDGLGHGQLAHKAATRAIETLENSNCLEIDKLMTGIHKALTNTVGVVLGLVIIDLEEGHLICSGVGNITIKIIGIEEKTLRLPKGILGYMDLKFASKTLPLNHEDVLIMHTDGIRDDYQLNPLTLSSPQILAQKLANDFYNPLDDALILVVNNMLSNVN